MEDERVCAFCGLGANAMEGLGEMMGPLDTESGEPLWFHKNCAVWSPRVRALSSICAHVAVAPSSYSHGGTVVWLLRLQVSEPEPGVLRNGEAEINRGRQLKCFRCGEYGATLGCYITRCPRSYHLPCAIKDKCQFLNRTFSIYCPVHARWPTKSRTKKEKCEPCDKQKPVSGINDPRAAHRDGDSSDEEDFRQREQRRLDRDLARIVPLKLGKPTFKLRG